MEGWIKLHRQIEENELWFSERFTKAQAWIDLLLLARHKPGLINIRGIEIKLFPGQLCYSQVSLSKRWQWDRKTVKKFLNELKKREMLDIRINKITTIISIKNWFSYQAMDNKTDIKTNNRMDTNKNDKKGKNILIGLSLSLIESLNKEPSLYSIINKYKAQLGEDKIFDILTSCYKRGNRFKSENELASYLQTCTKTNSQLTDKLSLLNEGEPGWM